jgi:hypothetical protein
MVHFNPQPHRYCEVECGIAVTTAPKISIVAALKKDRRRGKMWESEVFVLFSMLGIE